MTDGRELNPARWQRSYPGEYGFIFVQWEKMERHLSLDMLMVKSKKSIHMTPDS